MTSPSRADSDLFELRHAATDRAMVVVVGERRLFAIDGIGAPTGGDYRMATEVLRAVSGRLHDLVAGRGAGVADRPILETAWWTHPEVEPADAPKAFSDRSTWHWQQMIELDRNATDAEAESAIDATRRAAGREQPVIRVVHPVEGRVAQILHLGGHKTEAQTLERLYDEVARQGLRPHGHIHELRIADELHVPVDRVRTILRVPIDPS